jgi:hypothetical protein
MLKMKKRVLFLILSLLIIYSAGVIAECGRDDWKTEHHAGDSDWSMADGKVCEGGICVLDSEGNVECSSTAVMLGIMDPYSCIGGNICENQHYAFFSDCDTAQAEKEGGWPDAFGASVTYSAGSHPFKKEAMCV